MSATLVRVYNDSVLYTSPQLCSHYTDEETEARRGEVTFPKFQDWDLNPGHLAPEFLLLNTMFSLCVYDFGLGTSCGLLVTRASSLASYT